MVGRRRGVVAARGALKSLRKPQPGVIDAGLLLFRNGASGRRWRRGVDRVFRPELERREDVVEIRLVVSATAVGSSPEVCNEITYLAEHAEARHQIADDPEAVPAMVEGLLRWETPVMGTARVATRDTEIDGFAISEGEHVMSLLGAANVDEAEFPDADELVWDRPTNRHLAFGGGIHRCLGSHLARLELRIALRGWHQRIPDYRIKPGVELGFTAGIRTLDAFPMLLGAGNDQ